MHSVEAQYNKLQKSINFEELRKSVTYSTPVNFKEALSSPRHRWFPYKEGFSPSFVSSFIAQNIRPGQCKIIDPFSGSGTTALVAAQLGNFAVGIDVNPLVNFVAETKSLGLNQTEINSFKKQILDFKKDPLQFFAPLPPNETVVSYFSPNYLEAILKVKNYVLGVEGKKNRDLFKLAFLGLLETFSTHRKAGNGLKRKTNAELLSIESTSTCLQNFRDRLTQNLELFFTDIENHNISGRAKYYNASALDFNYSSNNFVNEFDGALTSPPYANCFDYSKIYCVELWFGDFFKDKQDQRQFRMDSIRSHVHASWPERHLEMGSEIVRDYVKPYLTNEDLWSNKIPSMLEGYFCDIGKLLHQMNVTLKTGSPFGLVVSNSAYGGIPIATDLIISEIAEQLGFETEKIVVYRGIVPSSQQFTNLKFGHSLLRESLVLLRKG